METSSMASAERDAEKKRVMMVLSEHLRNNMRTRQEEEGAGADFVAVSGSKAEDRKEQWQTVSVKLSSHLQQRQKELADREVKRKTTLAAIRKGEERRRVEKVLNAHLLTKLSRTAYTESAETASSDKWDWEREKVSKMLSEHLRFRKKFKKTTEAEATDTNSKTDIADMLSEHLRVKIQKMKHVSPSSLPAGKSEKQIAAEKISAHLRARVQKAKVQAGVGESKKMDKKRVAEMLSEHLRMKIRKAKGLESSVETAAMDKARVAEMLSQHLRLKMQHASSGPQHCARPASASSVAADVPADACMDAAQKQRVAQMLSEHLRLKVQQMQHTSTPPETAEAVFTPPATAITTATTEASDGLREAASDGVDEGSIDKARVATMLERHLGARMERARQAEAREAREAREEGRIDKQRVSDMLSKHLRTKVQRARALQAEREAMERHKKHVKEVLTSHLETVCKTRLGLGPSSSGRASTAAGSDAPASAAAEASAAASDGAGCGGGGGGGGGKLPSGEHLQRLFDKFLETLDMDKAQVYRQLQAGALSHAQLKLRLQSPTPELDAAAEEGGELAPLLRSLFLHLLTAPDDEPQPSPQPAAASQSQPTPRPLRPSRASKTAAPSSKTAPVAAPQPPPKSSVTAPVSLGAARRYTLQHAWTCAGQRWLRSPRSHAASSPSQLNKAAGADANKGRGKAKAKGASKALQTHRSSSSSSGSKSKRAAVQAPLSMLWTGCAGAEVGRLQEALARVGLLGRADAEREAGFFGHLTRAALTDMQQTHALPPPHTGVYDEASRGALVAALDAAEAAADLDARCASAEAGGGGRALMAELKAALARKHEELAKHPPTGIRAGHDVPCRFQACGPRPADPACPRECLLEEVRAFALAPRLRRAPPPTDSADRALARALLLYQVKRGTQQAPAVAFAPPPPLPPPPPPPLDKAPAAGQCGTPLPAALRSPPSPSQLLLMPPPPMLLLAPPPPTLLLAPPPPAASLSAPAGEDDAPDSLSEEAEHVEIPEVVVYDGEEELEDGVLCFD